MKPDKKWINLSIYQCVWFGSVLMQEGFLLPSLALLCLHLITTRNRLVEVAVVVMCGALGISTDLMLTHYGLYEFPPTLGVFGFPLWLVAIWLAFAATLRHSLRYFIAHPVLGLSSAAVGAPLSYLAASRLGAVELPMGMVNTFLVLAFIWVILMGVFIILINSLERVAGLGVDPGAAATGVDH